MFETIGTYGIAGGGIIAVGIFLYSFISNKMGKDTKFDLNNLRKLTQGKSEKKIESITHDQAKIEVKLKQDDSIAIEKQVAIRKVADEAAIKVEAIMKEKDLSKLTTNYNNDLEDL